MLKEKRNKGFVANLVVAAIVLTCSIAFFVYHQSLSSSKPADFPAFNSEATQPKNGLVSIDVYGISKRPIAKVDNKTEIWLVAYQKGYVGLQANKNDKTIKKLQNKAEQLKNKPEKLVVKFYNVRTGSTKKTIKNYSGYMRNFFLRYPKFSRYFSFNTYLSLSGAKSDNLFTLLMGIVCLGIALFFLGNAFFVRKKINQAYDDFYQEYPELQGNVEHLLSEAQFHDAELQIVIYKNHLITYYKGFAITDLRQTVQLYHHILKTYSGFFVTNRQSTLIAIHMQDGKQKKQRLAFKNTGKHTDEQLQSTFAYINDHFPTIILGV